MSYSLWGLIIPIKTFQQFQTIWNQFTQNPLKWAAFLFVSFVFRPHYKSLLTHLVYILVKAFTGLPRSRKWQAWVCHDVLRADLAKGGGCWRASLAWEYEKCVRSVIWEVWCENGSNCVTVTLRAWHLAALRSCLKHMTITATPQTASTCVVILWAPGLEGSGQSSSDCLRERLPSDPLKVVLSGSAGQFGSPVSHHIVLMRTNVINLLNLVSEHDSLTFFLLHRTKCKWMNFERDCFSDVTLNLILTLTLTLNRNPNPKP